MTCKLCGQACCKPDKTQPSVKVFVKNLYDTTGHWAHPMKDSDLCWYHAKKVAGHFDRGEEYFRFNRGPHECVPYNSFYPPGSQYL